MSHIETTRLIDLSQQALIDGPDEIAHLQQCEECSTLFRSFVRQHRTVRELFEQEKGHSSRTKDAF